MAHDLFQRYRKRSFGTGLKMYDACAVACLLEPDLFDMTKAFVDVEIAGELTAGCTVVDLKATLSANRMPPSPPAFTQIDSATGSWTASPIVHSPLSLRRR